VLAHGTGSEVHEKKKKTKAKLENQVIKSITSNALREKVHALR